MTIDLEGKNIKLNTINQKKKIKDWRILPTLLRGRLYISGASTFRNKDCILLICNYLILGHLHTFLGGISASFQAHQDFFFFPPPH